MRVWLFIIFFGITVCAFAQDSEIVSENVNPFLYYSWGSHASKAPNYGKLDTLNICRTRSNLIKSVQIWFFTTPEDSSLLRTVNYNKNGFRLFPTDSIPQKGDLPYQRFGIDIETCSLDCPEVKVNFPELAGKTKRKVISLFPLATEIRKYDSLGYLNEYSAKNKGLLYALFAPYTREARYYTYSEQYKNVNIKLTLSKKDAKDYFNLYTRATFDKNRNLVTEESYYEDEETELEFRKKFRYTYEYFEPGGQNAISGH